MASPKYILSENYVGSADVPAIVSDLTKKIVLLQSVELFWEVRMKKVALILIFVAAAVAIFTVVAGQNDIFKSAEAEKAAVEKKIESVNMNKDAKIPLRTIKLQKIKMIDKEKLRENIKKKKEKPNKTPSFNKKHESCGE